MIFWDHYEKGALNLMGGVMWRLHYGCTFGDIFEVSGYLGDNCGIFWGHYKIKCIDSCVALRGGCILAALGLFWEYLWDIGIS